MLTQLSSLIVRPALALMALTVISAAHNSLLQAEDLFPDKGLEAAVRKEVFAKRYNTEPLTKDDVKNISQVMGKGKGIKSLAGLEHCVAVQEIDLENNEITDLTPMAGLKLVQSLTLTKNKIESIAPLAELERLQYLELSGNAVSDLTPLTKMTNMRSLYLSNNKIAKIEVVKGLKKVWSLYLDGNPVEDLTPVGELKWLDRLDVRGCNVEKLDFLKPLTELKYVMLAENKITDLAVLVEMAKADQSKKFAPFWNLYLYDNPLSDKAKGEQVAELKAMGGRVFLEKPKAK
ncbi:MAG: leucine-rich repeat domain-containing protein [Pirellulaceae bacterium]|nr:leucine-rich repeat domain-containing protein [Pirellulaceae bacterium]